MASVPRVPIVPQPTRQEDAGIERGATLSQLLARIKGVIHDGMPDSVWVRAEITRADTHGGHIYLDLNERSQDGMVIAKCRAMIWSDLAKSIEAKFAEMTGGPLKKDIKVLCLGRITFHEYHGLSLQIEDVDPSYTLGDLAARLAQIRNQLASEGISDKNRRLSKPTEFVRVAIISPRSSAGLGDFQREADYLEKHQLCRFSYFTASFQGPDTAKSIMDAIRAAFEHHTIEPFDALAIIRGGGSATDLAWLNEFTLAKWVCRVPIPVFTGIGHKQDNTILDEIAHTRFDTPSKVVLHIVASIWNNAAEALKSVERIRERTGAIIAQEAGLVATQTERVRDRAHAWIAGSETSCANHHKTVCSLIALRLRESTAALERTCRTLEANAGSLTNTVEQNLVNLANIARERSLSRLAILNAKVDQGARELLRDGLNHLDRSTTTLESAYTQVTDDALRSVTHADAELSRVAGIARERTLTRIAILNAEIDQNARAMLLSGRTYIDRSTEALELAGKQVVGDAVRAFEQADAEVARQGIAVKKSAIEALETATLAVESDARTILASGPEATLRRGFALARDDAGQPLPRRSSVIASANFRLQFHDGVIRVSNLEREPHDERAEQ